MTKGPQVPSHPLVIVGPTASGKSSVAMAVAGSFRASGQPVEVVSADSMQVYRGMDIGTAKPSVHDRERVPHHLIDVVDPGEEFSVARFVRLAREALEGIASRGASAIVVGGTGLYVQALVDGLEIPGQYPEVRERLEAEPATNSLHEMLRDVDPDAASRIEANNRRRLLRALEVTIGSGRPFSTFGPGMDHYPETPFTMVGIEIDRAALGRRILDRLHSQVREGFVDEVATLGSTVASSRTAAQALGYPEIRRHLAGEATLDAAIEDAALRTRQFAVRQIKWFRRDPRIRWFHYDDDPLDVAAPIEAHWRTAAVGTMIGDERDDRI